MKHLLLSNLFAVLICQAVQAQPVAKTDATALLGELPAPPTTVADAYQRVYAKDAASPNTQAYYQPWLDKCTQAARDGRTASSSGP